MRGDAKVISLRERLAGYGGTRIDADTIEEPGTPEPAQPAGACARCGSAGVTDFVDLVAQRAKMHCPACQHYWDEQLAEPDDDDARARLAVRRADAATRRHRH